MFLLVIYKNELMALHVAKSYHELMNEAKEAEENKELENAAKIYEKAIKAEPHEEQPYGSLMVIYRKLTWFTPFSNGTAIKLIPYR